VEDEEHRVTFDQLARLLDSLRRAIAVVVGDVVDFAAVEAALRVDHPEERGLAITLRAREADGPLYGIGLPILVSVSLLLRAPRSRHEQGRPAQPHCCQKLASCLIHPFLPDRLDHDIPGPLAPAVRIEVVGRAGLYPGLATMIKDDGTPFKSVAKEIDHRRDRGVPKKTSPFFRRGI
jgi:hypothetical protein